MTVLTTLHWLTVHKRVVFKTLNSLFPLPLLQVAGISGQPWQTYCKFLELVPWLVGEASLLQVRHRGTVFLLLATEDNVTNFHMTWRAICSTYDVLTFATDQRYCGVSLILVLDYLLIGEVHEVEKLSLTHWCMLCAHVCVRHRLLAVRLVLRCGRKRSFLWSCRSTSRSVSLTTRSWTHSSSNLSTMCTGA